MSLPDRQTSTDDLVVPQSYLSYRVTLDHINVDKIRELVCKHADEYLIWPHTGDSEVANPHFHIIIPTEDLKLADRVRHTFGRTFERSGNEFHAAKFHVNGVGHAISYLKHDQRGTPTYAGSYWSKLIECAVPLGDESHTAVHRGKQPRERLGDYVLTYSNVIKQAIKHRGNEKNLQKVLMYLERIGWIPSRELLSNGIPEEFYALWDQRIGEKKQELKLWMQPHQRSEKKKEWQDVPCFSRYND